MTYLMIIGLILFSEITINLTLENFGQKCIPKPSTLLWLLWDWIWVYRLSNDQCPFMVGTFDDYGIDSMTMGLILCPHITLTITPY